MNTSTDQPQGGGGGLRNGVQYSGNMSGVTGGEKPSKEEDME